MWRKKFDLAFNSKNKFMIRVSSLADGKLDGLKATISVEEANTFNPVNDL